MDSEQCIVHTYTPPPHRNAQVADAVISIIITGDFYHCHCIFFSPCIDWVEWCFCGGMALIAHTDEMASTDTHKRKLWPNILWDLISDRQAHKTYFMRFPIFGIESGIGVEKTSLNENRTTSTTATLSVMARKRIRLMYCILLAHACMCVQRELLWTNCVAYWHFKYCVCSH